MSKPLSFILLIVSLLLPLSAQISNDSLIVYFPFNGNANDSSGNGLDGEVSGAQLTTDRYGNLNSAYYFDGVDDYINLGNSTKLKPYPPVTISCWIKHDAGEAGIISNDINETQYYGIWLAIRLTREIYLNVGNGGTIGPYSRKGKKVLTPGYGEWFHFAGTIDDSLNFTLYINGEKVAADDYGYGSSLVYSTGDCVLGMFDNNAHSGPDHLEGKLDDFRMYHRILSDEEIETLALNDNGDNSSSYTLSIDSFPVIKTYDAVAPVDIKMPDGESFSSFQFSISGFSDDAEFVSVVEDESTLLSDDWLIAANTKNDTLIIAGSSSGSCDSSGTLLKLKFRLNSPDTAKTIPLYISKALCDTGSSSVTTSNGAIIVMNPSVFKPGDVDYNKVVQPYDASLILKYLVGKIEFTQPKTIAADVSLDSTVSAYDASLILNYITGKIDSLPYTHEDSLTSQNLEFSMPDITASSKNEIVIPVYLKSSAKIVSLEDEFTYDADLLEFSSIQTSGALSEFSYIDYNYDNGKLKFATFGTKTNVDNALLLNVIFYNKTGEDITDDITLTKVKINEDEAIENVTASHLITGIDDEIEKPTRYSLTQNYPNPFNPATKITYTIPQSGLVTLKIYNTLGQLVKTLVNESKTAGKYSVTFDASNLASGIYFYRIISGSFIETKKMMLIK